jgi:hypothetical protein
MTLSTIVLSLIIGLLISQVRAVQWGASTLSARAQLRDAAVVLAADLRGTSVRGDTIRLLSDSGVELFAPLGSSALCDSSAGMTFTLPPLRFGGGATLTSWTATPDTGDLAVVLLNDSTPTWQRYRIASVSSRSVSTACATTNQLSSGATSTTAYAVTLRQLPAQGLPAGTPVQFVRRTRYSLYRASDGKWYLGQRRCNAVDGACTGIQPVSGPFRSYSAGSAGITMRYYDAGGAQLAGSISPLQVARIELSLRADRRAFPGMPGPSNRIDSTVVVIALRNQS